MSHLAWVCGLKHVYYDNRGDEYNVTPCVGVWIETSSAATLTIQYKVTPCVGVWIETNSSAIGGKGLLSHLAWVCGLKQ